MRVVPAKDLLANNDAHTMASLNVFSESTNLCTKKFNKFSHSVSGHSEHFKENLSKTANRYSDFYSDKVFLPDQHFSLDESSYSNPLSLYPQSLSISSLAYS